MDNMGGNGPEADPVDENIDTVYGVGASLQGRTHVRHH